MLTVTDRARAIRDALLKRGITLAHIASELQVGRSAVSNALRSPSLVVEEAIARHLGLSPADVFPDRYDNEGRRICGHRKRTTSDAHRRNAA